MVVADNMSHLGTLSERLLRMALDHHLTLAEIVGRTGLRLEEVRSGVASSLTELERALKEEPPDAH